MSGSSAALRDFSADLIFTDPPFDMPGKDLANILDGISADHLVLLTSMRQLFGLVESSSWMLSFDFVLDAVVPKKSKSYRQPHYTHVTGVYLTRNGAKSLFDRRKRQRSDTFDGKKYWPTILRAPRERLEDFGQAKNETAVLDILGSFKVKSVIDPFAGTGTVGMAAFELGMPCTLVENDSERFTALCSQFSFLGARVKKISLETT